MQLGLALRMLLFRAALGRHERWTRGRIEAYRSKRLRQLREYALVHSPFYRSFHKGLESRPLAELPVLQKRHLMESYDDVVTDPDIRLQSIRAFISSEIDSSLFLGRYRVCATSGTSGEPGVFVYDTNEWAWIIASYARANRWAGVQADLLHSLKMAMIGSPRPSHQSHAVTQSLESGWVHSLNLSTTDPLRAICQDLTAWQPQLLITYSAFAGMLADEQLDGRLAIAPAAVMCVAETLTHNVRERVETAWGEQPFETYAATETGCIAGECSRHAGLHIMDDLLEIEVVDEDYRPVPPGTMGAKLLVSVLFSRTLPLIRYEIDDAVMASTEKCHCGMPFHRFTRLGGRVRRNAQVRTARRNHRLTAPQRVRRRHRRHGRQALACHTERRRAAHRPAQAGFATDDPTGRDQSEFDAGAAGPS